MQLMADTFTFESTDKRDQIFALLGLLPDSACNIIANYKKSKAEVYTELALNLILQTGKLSVISYVYLYNAPDVNCLV
jgi:hypothetical protein